MIFLTAIETTDITKELPLSFWIGFVLIMIIVLPLANKLLTKMFIPKNGKDDAPVWERYNRKTPKY